MGIASAFNSERRMEMTMKANGGTGESQVMVSTRQDAVN